MYKHSVAVEAGTWYRVDTASGSNTPVTVTAPDGVTAVGNSFAGSGSTVRAISMEGRAEFTSSTQTLYLKRLTYKGVVAGDSPVTSTGADLTLPLPPASPGDAYGPQAGSDAWLKLHAGGNLDALITGTITRDSNGAATTAGVVWPDGTTGTYTATTVSSSFPGAVDAYTVTYAGATTKTVTQPAVSRDATTGAVTTRPAMTVA